MDETKVLIKSNGKYFTYQDSAFSEIELSVANFETHSIDLPTLLVPNEQGVRPIFQIENPEIIALGEPVDDLGIHLEGYRNIARLPEFEDSSLLINSTESLSTANVKAVPNPQMVFPSGDIVLKGVHEINSFDLTVTTEDTEDIKIICSVDSGESWLTYSTEASQFQPIEIDALDEVGLSGMTVDVFNSIGLKWNDIITEGKIRFAYYLDSNNIGILSGIDKLTVDVEAFYRWRKSHRGRDYEYEFFNEKLLVTLKEDGSYKINYMV